jgi:hypothetical protein
LGRFWVLTFLPVHVEDWTDLSQMNAAWGLGHDSSG